MITEPFFGELAKCISAANHSIIVVSPYVTVLGAEVIIQALVDRKSKNPLKIGFVTRPQGPEYITGFVEPRALLMLKDVGFEIRVLDSLHAKIYLIDDATVFIGSANVTAYGLGTAQDYNKEIMIQVTASPRDATQIRDEYFNLASLPEPTIDAAYVAQTEALAGKYKKENDKAVQRYMIQLPPPGDVYVRAVDELKGKGKISGFTRLSTNDFALNKSTVVKTFFSNPESENKYSFALAEKTGRSIKNAEYAGVLLILGKDSPVLLGIPAKEFKKVLSGKPRKGQWPFRVLYSDNRWVIQLGKGNSKKLIDVHDFLWQVPTIENSDIIPSGRIS